LYTSQNRENAYKQLRRAYKLTESIKLQQRISDATTSAVLQFSKYYPWHHILNGLSLINYLLPVSGIGTFNTAYAKTHIWTGLAAIYIHQTSLYINSLTTTLLSNLPDITNGRLPRSFPNKTFERIPYLVFRTHAGPCTLIRFTRLARHNSRSGSTRFNSIREVDFRIIFQTLNMLATFWLLSDARVTHLFIL
jgi:hypothetical protein